MEICDQRHAWPMYPREWAGTQCTRCWLDLRAGLYGCGKSRPHRVSIPGPSSQWRVTIPACWSQNMLVPLSDSYQCQVVAQRALKLCCCLDFVQKEFVWLPAGYFNPFFGSHILIPFSGVPRENGTDSRRGSDSNTAKPLLMLQLTSSLRSWDFIHKVQSVLWAR
jgi:hypothetical protein